MDPPSLSLQIQSAVSIALSPSTTASQAQQRSQAHEFLSTVKAASEQTWQACLEVFLAEEEERSANEVEGVKRRSGKGRASAEARMFALQVVGDR